MAKLFFFEDSERLRAVVTQLTERHEAAFAAPWKVSDAPATFIDAQLKAIVGFELPILRLEGKQKFNQNRAAADRSGVVAGLRGMGDERKTRVAELMETIEGRREPDGK